MSTKNRPAMNACHSTMLLTEVLPLRKVLIIITIIIANSLFQCSAGYPYLISKLCKFIDETIVPSRNDPNWSVNDVNEAFTLIVKGSYTTTLFDSLTKNLENHPELYEQVFQM